MTRIDAPRESADRADPGEAGLSPGLDGFRRRVLWSAIALFAFLLVVSTGQALLTESLPMFRIGVSGALVFSGLVVSRLDPSIQLSAVLVFVLLVPLTYGAEILSRALDPISFECRHEDPTMARRCMVATAEGKPFDRRQALEVLSELRARGEELTPFLTPFELRHDGQEAAGLPTGAIPLALPSSSDVLYCNESGSWERFRSDEWGFRNPPGLLGGDDLDIVLIGDSFTMGYCVPDDDTPAARLRSRGIRAASLGVDGNGPLRELASLREYGELAPARAVYWLFFEGNDFANLLEEYAAGLDGYIDGAYSRNLIAHREALDRWALSRAAEIEAEVRSQFVMTAPDGVLDGIRQSSFYDFLKLGHLRARLANALSAMRYSAALQAAEPDAAQLEPVMEAVLRETEKRSQSLTIVLLPSRERLLNEDAGDPAPEAVRELAGELGIEVIDFARSLQDGDPRRYLPLGMWGHYAPSGYDLLAEVIALHHAERELEAGGRR